MSREIKRPKKKRLFPRVLIIVSLIIALYFALMLFKQPIRTETVQYGSMENKVSETGYILFEEHVINSSCDGVLNCIAREGERVSAYSKIASIVKGDVDEAVWGKLNQINAEIESLENASTHKSLIISDEANADSIMEATIESVIDSVYHNDMEMISNYKDDIKRVIAYKSGNGEAVSDNDTKLAQLKAEKKALEDSAGGDKEDITAPISGMFSSNIDGFENAVDLSNLSSINAGTLEKLGEIEAEEKDRAVKGEPVVKIMDNYKWYFVASVETRWLNELKEDSLLKIKFPGISERAIDAKVEAINDGEDGQSVIVLSSSYNFNDVYSKREIEAEIIRETYNGFKISKSAVHITSDGVQGVYVVKDGLAAFHEIEVLYSGEDYVIVAENNQKENGLLLYDEVILSPNIKEGDVV